jgi:hypothetical protein
MSGPMDTPRKWLNRIALVAVLTLLFYLLACAVVRS